MKEIVFTWDKNKDLQNLRKHGIAFAEARTVFYDEQALLLDDPGHSSEEDRFVLLGLSAVLHLLVVCHCALDHSGVIRIISARKATRQEQRQYTERAQ